VPDRPGRELPTGRQYVDRVTDSQVSASIPTRGRGAGWVPNQHGAWAMLASPLLVGVLAAGPARVHLPLAAFWFAGYFAFFATGLWLKSRRRARYLPPVRAFAVLTTLLGAVVLLMEPRLIRWLPAFVVPLGIGLWSSARRRDRSLLSGLSTTVGSALMTLVAYDAGGGEQWLRAWVLAAVQAAYFAGTVFYVKSLIRARGDETFRRLSVGFHVACAVAAAAAVIGLQAADRPHPWGVSWWVVAVFALLAARAAWVPRLRTPLRPAQIGIGEIVSTLAVALASVLA